MKMKRISILMPCLLFGIQTMAQIGYGTAFPSNSAVVDIFSAHKGILIPRLKLSATNSNSPIANPINSLLVFNTETAGDVPNNVLPGYYYYFNNGWKRLNDGNNWNFTGNAGLDASKHFIGTTDNQDVIFNVNKTFSGLLNSAARNTSFGISSFNAASSGHDNTSIGYQTLSTNVDGNYNTAFGNNSLLKNQTGEYNVALGYSPLSENLSGNNNVAMNFNSLSKSTQSNGNTASGVKALGNNDVGEYNLALGNVALQFNTSGSYNTAAGFYALSENTLGNNNIAVGNGALPVNKMGSNNIAFSGAALALNINGANNIAYGNAALSGNPAGNYNIAIGLAANSQKIGDHTIAMGGNAGQFFNSGSNNIFLGHNTVLGIDLVLNSDKIGSNVLNIGNVIYVLHTGSPTVKVGINTFSPNSTLAVEGAIGFNAAAYTSGEVSDKDFTVMVSGAISLPAPSPANIGRIYNLINDKETGSSLISLSSGKFKDNGDELTTLTIGKAEVNGYIVQSTGVFWQVISKH